MARREGGGWARAATLHVLSPLPLPRITESWNLRAILLPPKGLGYSLPVLHTACRLPGSLLEAGAHREEKTLRHSERAPTMLPS